MKVKSSTSQAKIFFMLNWKKNLDLDLTSFDSAFKVILKKKFFCVFLDKMCP